MPKENYTISAFHGGLNNSSDPRDIKNEDLSVASGIDVSNIGRVSIMNGEELHFSTGVTGENPAAALAFVQPGYGLFSYKTDALGTSSQSNNFIRSQQIQYGSSGHNSFGKVTFRLNELIQGDSPVVYKLMITNSSISAGVSGAELINDVYYIPISSSNTINRGTPVQDITNNLVNSINSHSTTGNDTWTEFSAIKSGNEVKISADTQTQDGNGSLILHNTSGVISNIDFVIEDMSGGMAAQHQKTRFIFPADNISAITYFITLDNSDRYTIAGHTDDKPFHILNRFIHANGTSDQSSHANHPVYSNGTLSASASQNVLKLNGSTDTDGIDGNASFTATLEVSPNSSTNVSLIENHNFGDGSLNWESAQFTFSGAPGSPIATFSDSSTGHLKQTGFTIKANTLYQLSFIVSVATLDLTFKDYANSNTYVTETSYAAGTHTLWFYQTVERTGIYINANTTSAGAGAITEIKLQEVLKSFIVETTSNDNFLVSCGIEQSEGYVGNRWLAICDRNSNVHTFSNTAGDWNTPISLGSGNNAKGVFYFVDGALRVSDSNFEETTESTPFNSTNKPKWYGYVDRYFYGTSAAGYGTRSEYYINRFITADVGLHALDVMSSNLGSAAIQTTSAKPVNLQFTQASESGSTWALGANTTYEIAVTTLYDDSKQESVLDIPDNESSQEITDGNKLKVKFGLWANNTTGVHQIHPRVKGFHIYMRESGRNDWFLQWEVDIEKGIRPFKTGDFSAWVSGSVGTTQANCESSYLLDPRQIENYEVMTSRDQSYSNASLDTLGNCWRSALIANRRAWIAGPTMQDESGNTVTKGDTMVKSNVNQFDSFTLDNRVDVAIRDGEDIVAIAEFGDRILQFKQQTLYIINISQDFEFLEATFKNRGIVNHNAQCRTDYGIAWVNESGCFLYDGKRVNNLLEQNNIDVIDISTWTDFVNKNTVIGFAPKHKQLVILQSSIVSTNTNSNNDVFVYDLVIGAWTRGYNKWTNKNKTNFLTDWEDGLIIGHNPVGQIKGWGSNSFETVYELVTKDIDFGKPAIRKKFYKVYITYKCSVETTNVRVQYYVNGSTTAYNFKPIENATLDSGESRLDGNKSDWTTAVLRPSSSSESNNIYSIKIRLYNASPGLTVPKEFQINDISLIHRRKPVK